MHISEVINRFKLASARVKAKKADQLLDVPTDLGDSKSMTTNWSYPGEVKAGSQTYNIFTTAIYWVNEGNDSLMQVGIDVKPEEKRYSIHYYFQNYHGSNPELGNIGRTFNFDGAPYIPPPPPII